MIKIEKLKNNEVMKQIIKESFGGVMYNVANRNKYDTTELLSLWDELTETEKGSVDGILKGAINFIKGN